MLECFQQWGMPKAVRSDNGEPFGVPTRDVIPQMSLWLQAWGVRPILNRPRRPQDNAHVENNQATVARWAEIYNCKSVTEMQQSIDKACAFQRDDFPVRRIGNATRKEVFASLYDNQTRFEEAVFCPYRAYEMLGKAVYPRKVSERGTISLYNKRFQAGLRLKNKTLLVKFNVKEQQWECWDDKQHIVKTIEDPRFSPTAMREMNQCE